jgi:NAD(P)-dependent dehydrogenase (short-subunit alcohol dehydrogenase family)
MGILQGRVALIVGGASGIGRAAARRFAREGAAVAVADRQEEAGREVAARIADEGGRSLFLPVDVTDEEAVQAMVSGAETALGPFDIWVQAAGILRGDFEAIEEIAVETWREVLEVNLTGAFTCARHVVPALVRAGGGVILLIGSGAGVAGASSSLAYAASKGGLNGLAMTLAAQLAPRGIRVHFIAPGGVDTPMKRENLRKAALRAGRAPEEALLGAGLVDPDGIAGVLAFLASADGEYVRGNVFTR